LSQSDSKILETELSTLKHYERGSDKTFRMFSNLDKTDEYVLQNEA